MSKIKEILTDDIYVKVTPKGSWFRSNNEAEICESQCEDMEKQINRHTDDVGSTEIVRTYKYIYEEDEYTKHEGNSLKELCEEIAYQRDLITYDNDCFVVKYFDKDFRECTSKEWSFEGLLEHVVEKNIFCIIGKLSDYQKILIDIAIELNDRELNIQFKE